VTANHAAYDVHYSVACMSIYLPTVSN